MEELRNNSAVPPSDAAEQPSQKDTVKALNPGERMSSILFIVIGGVFFWQSLLIYQKYPSISGPAMFPMLISGLLLLLTLINFIQKCKTPAVTDGLSFKEKLVATIKHLFPIDSFVFLLFSIAFYVAMVLGVPFFIAATLFLLGSMCYLIPREFKKNLIYTAIIMVAIYVIFKLLFKVNLP